MLILNFLGNIKIELDGVDVSDAVSHKSAAILALLMSKKNKKISRRELLGFLWPESSEEAAKYNLRYNIWQLKKILNPTQDENSFLIVTRDSCLVNEDYEYYCDFSKIMSTNIKTIDDIDKMEELYSLFKGDFFENIYFTDCDEFSEMIILQRYSLENQKLLLVKKLVKKYYDTFQLDKCLDTLIHCEELDPYDENNAEIRLKILIKNGRYNDAIKYYQHYYNKLTLDIGIEPSDKIKKLAQTIKIKPDYPDSDIVIKAISLEHVTYYLMSDIIGGLVKTDGFSVEKYLDKESVSDLAYIQHSLGKYECTPSTARIANAFISLISRMCDSGIKIVVNVQGDSDADPVSKDIINYLTCRYKDRFRIQIKMGVEQK